MKLLLTAKCHVVRLQFIFPPLCDGIQHGVEVKVDPFVQRQIHGGAVLFHQIAAIMHLPHCVTALMTN